LGRPGQAVTRVAAQSLSTGPRHRPGCSFKIARTYGWYQHPPASYAGPRATSTVFNARS